MKMFLFSFLAVSTLTICSEELRESLYDDITIEESSSIQAAEPSYTLVEEKSTISILNPSLSDRVTEKLILENGMNVYLISDPGADQSAAGVAVGAGSWEDPEEYPGMAHFCEHMLFMGTKAYPKEFEYMQYITDHGGSVNAFTASDRTVYMFSINNDAFESALNRFSHFFIDPLFSPNSIDRELHAVDQEHSKNIEHDGWRQYMILKETGNPSHPNSGFSTGNAQTLGGIPQSALKAWYETHYSADRMHLVMISPQSIEEMRTLALRDFSAVPTFAVTEKNITMPMTSSQQVGHILFIKPVKDIKQLSLSWEVPSEYAADISKSAPALVAYALSQDGENTLTQTLKNEKIAESVNATCDRFSKNSLLFSIDITLTDYGLTQLDSAIMKIYQAIARIRDNGYPEYLFNELQTMAKLNYQYQSRDDAFQTIMESTSEIVYEDLQTYPQMTKVPTTYDPAFIHSFVETLKPENCITFLIADPNKTGVLPDTKEKWMNAEYSIKAISKSRMAAWEKAEPAANIQLPQQNPYIPSQLALLPIPQNVHNAENPLLLYSDEGSKIYFAQDTRYLVPEVVTIFNFQSPLITTTAKSQVLADLYIRALTEKLSSPLSMAAAAGLRTTLNVDGQKLQIRVQGFDDKAPLLLGEIFQTLKNVNCSKDAFEIYRSSLSSDYDNSSKELPVRQAMGQLDSILFNTPTEQERVKAIKTITYEEFSEFTHQLFQMAYTEGTLYGNINQKQAQDLWQNLNGYLGAAPYPVQDHSQRKVLTLSEKHGPFKVIESTPRGGSGVLLMLQEGSFTYEKKAIQQILGTALADAFFDTLRTKQQTAYFAKAWNTEEERQLMQFFAVQSSTHTPSDLLARFELFLEDFNKNLTNNISEGRFESLRSNLIILLKMPPENMPGMASLINDLAFEYKDFNRIQKRIDSLKALSYQNFCKTANQLLSRDNTRRLAILMEGLLTPENDFHYEEISKDDVSSVGTFVTVK